MVSRNPFSNLSGRARLYAEYRDGLAKPVTLAGQSKPRPILNRERREHFLDIVTNHLRSGRLTPFEHEGACRHGVRSKLVLEGYAWRRSEAQAADLVSSALHILGAVRPDFIEGQRSYTVPRENCKWCSVDLDEETIAAGQPYCSDLCRRRAYVFRAFEAGGKKFIPRTDPKFCLECNKEFHPKDRRVEYCSKSCAARGRHREFAAKHEMRNCQACGTHFQPSSVVDRFCSRRCGNTFRAKIYYHRRKSKITPQNFDFMLMEQGLRITSTVAIDLRKSKASEVIYLTPRLFDQMVCAEAA